MTKRIRWIALGLICFTTPTTSAIAADTYTIDPTHTSVVFSVSHSTISFVYGMFTKAAGAYSIDKDHPENSRFRFVIQADSIFTNYQKRDDYLRTAAFFDVQKYPEIVFETTKCTYTNTQEGGVLYQLTGNLTMHGQTRIVTLPLRMLGEGPGAYGDTRSGFLCQVELKRSEFNMPGLLDTKLVGDAIGVTISFEGVLQPPGTTAPRAQ